MARIYLSAFVVMFGLILIVVGCGGSSSSGSFQDTALSRIPKAVSPVIATSSSATLLQATAGTGLGLARQASDDNGNQYTNFVAPTDLGTKITDFGACETHNAIGNGLTQAATADSLTCLLGQLIPEDQISIFADGAEHIVTISSDEDGDYKLKFSATLNSNNQISNFTMFICQSGSQTGFVSQEIDGNGNLTMTSIGSAEPDNAEVDSVQYLTTVSGVIDLSTNQFTGTKTITQRYENDFSANSNSGANHVESTITQTADTVTYNGYDCSKANVDATTCDRSSTYYIVSQLLNNNSSAYDININLYALGHGAYVQSAGEAATGWNGDTGATDSDAAVDEIALVEAGKAGIVTASGDFEDISFTDAQTWDCSGESEASFSGDDSATDVCFGRYDVNQDLRLECSNL